MAVTYTITETWPDNDITRNWAQGTAYYPSGLTLTAAGIGIEPIFHSTDLAPGHGSLIMELKPKDTFADNCFLVTGDGVMWQFIPQTTGITVGANRCYVYVDATHYLAIEWNVNPSFSGVGGMGVTGVALDAGQTWYRIVYNGTNFVYDRAASSSGPWNNLGSVAQANPIAHIRIGVAWDGGYPWTGSPSDIPLPQLGHIAASYSLKTVDKTKDYNWHDLTKVADVTKDFNWNTQSSYYVPNLTGSHSGTHTVFSPRRR